MGSDPEYTSDPVTQEAQTVAHAGNPAAPRVLVTGGTGFVGRVLVPRLVADGYRVRVLTRRPAKVDEVHAVGAEVCRGDVADVSSFGRAMEGCDMVVHLAAGTSGSVNDSQSATLQGTRNLLDLCRQHRPRRLVYISSCSVYGVADYRAGAVVSETASLERFPERRGAYSASKLEAEGYVTESMAASSVPTVILRPGTIYGPGGQLYTPMMGFSTGSLYLVIGTGGFELPLVYVDNLVEAIVLSLQKDQAVGQIFNVVDPERLDKRTYMNRVMRRVDPGARVVYVPYSILYAVTWLQEQVFAIVKRRPALSCYRLISSQRRVSYDSSRIATLLGWKPIVPVNEAIDRMLTFPPTGAGAVNGGNSQGQRVEPRSVS